MSEPKTGQMFQAPNNLRLKVGGGRLGAIDPAAIAKAEAALKSLSGNFAQWLNDEIAKLEKTKTPIRIAPSAVSSSAHTQSRCKSNSFTRTSRCPKQ